MISVTNLDSTNGSVSGDPQFVGLRGQPFQVHGIDGAVYNLISGHDYQLNARFAFLHGPRACPSMPSSQSTACWNHPGSYLSEIGLKIAPLKRYTTSAFVRPELELYVAAGPASEGFTDITLNGRTMDIWAGPLDMFVSTYGNVAFILNSTHELLLVFDEWTIEIENSDMFLNFRSIRIATESWSSLRTHGLIGQTWSNKRHKGSISAIEGEVDDYVIMEESVFGDSFLFNQYGSAPETPI